jgi:tRNA A37 threonylcarbamoyladenosine modification protein TsaB
LGLAAGAGLPVVSVPTLDALARAQGPFEGLVCAFVDARRGEAYYCLYDVQRDGIDRLSEYAVKSPGAMLADVGDLIEGRPPETVVLMAGPRGLVDRDRAGSSLRLGRENSADRPVEVPLEALGRSDSDSGAPRVLIASPERAAPKPAAVAALGVELCREGKASAIDEVKPIYVRRSDAELRRKKKTRTS